MCKRRTKKGKPQTKVKGEASRPDSLTYLVYTGNNRLVNCNLSKMPTAGEASKAKRAREEAGMPTLPGMPAKKPCDPRTDAAALKTKEPGTTRKATQPTKPGQPGPTEAQIRHAEMVKKAREEQANQAKLAAQAKAGKTGNQYAASMPVITPTEILAPTTSTSAATEAAERNFAEDDDVVETGRRTLTPNPDTNANFTFTYEQKAAAIDLNFTWTLADDPRKALEIARNTREVNQAKEAIKALEDVSKYKPKEPKKQILTTTHRRAS